MPAKYFVDDLGILDAAVRVASRAAAVLVNGTTIFTIANGPIRLDELVALCETANDATASTLQYSADPSAGAVAAATFSAASASLANAAIGTTVVFNGTALATAPDIVVGGVGLASVKARGIIIPAGIITTTVAVGSTTGTWSFFMRYVPLARNVVVT